MRKDAASPAPGARKQPNVITDSSTPRPSGPFRIHAIAELTGVPEPTLRAWERRYGVPAPERTASGYRLYSAKEVDQVREILRLCAGGMSTAEAAARARSGIEATTITAAVAPRIDDPMNAARDSIVSAIERFDERVLDLEIRKAMVLGASTTIIDHVFGPALRNVGAKWHAGELSVAQEHLASERLGTAMRDMLRLASTEDSQLRVLLACFAEERHDLGLVAAATRMAAWGLRPVVLGACTPPDAVRAAVAALNPRLVALSVTIAPDRRRLRPLMDRYAAACSGVPWIAGGAAAASMGKLVRSCGGSVAPEDNAELRAFVLDLVSHSNPTPKKKGGIVRRGAK